jgi:hypothetical protein
VRPLTLMLVVLLAAGCRRSVPMGSEIANQRLHDHILDKHRKVFVERLGGDTIWSDVALIERARVFPPPIKELIDTRPGPDDASIGRDVMVQFLQDVDRRKAEWRPASVRRKGTADLDCEIGDAAEAAAVNCIYANYLEARYPKAKFLVKAKLEPVLLVEKDTVRAAIMPVKL